MHTDAKKYLMVIIHWKKRRSLPQHVWGPNRTLEPTLPVGRGVAVGLRRACAVCSAILFFHWAVSLNTVGTDPFSPSIKLVLPRIGFPGHTWKFYFQNISIPRKTVRNWTKLWKWHFPTFCYKLLYFQNISTLWKRSTFSSDPRIYHTTTSVQLYHSSEWYDFHRHSHMTYTQVLHASLFHRCRTPRNLTKKQPQYRWTKMGPNV